MILKWPSGMCSIDNRLHYFNQHTLIDKWATNVYILAWNTQMKSKSVHIMSKLQGLFLFCFQEDDVFAVWYRYESCGPYCKHGRTGLVPENTGVSYTIIFFTHGAGSVFLRSLPVTMFVINKLGYQVFLCVFSYLSVINQNLVNCIWLKMISQFKATDMFTGTLHKGSTHPSYIDVW